MDAGTLVTQMRSIYARLQSWDTIIRASIMDEANSPEMKMANGFCEVHVKYHGRVRAIRWLKENFDSRVNRKTYIL